MLKKIITLLLLNLLLLTGCSSSVSKNTNTEVDITQNSFNVNKELFKDDRIDLTCKEITSDSIIFECKNKTDRDILFNFDISLDGILQSMWSDMDESTVLANETKKFSYYFQDSIENVEHASLSLFGIGFVDGSEYMSFDIVDFDLGGNSNPDKLESGEKIFSSDLIDVEYIGKFAQGMNFLVDNKSTESLSLYITDIIINNELDGYGNAFSIPAKSKGIISYYVTNYIENFNGDDINTLNANFILELPNAENVNLCEFVYDNDSITSHIFATDLYNEQNKDA